MISQIDKLVKAQSFTTSASTINKQDAKVVKEIARKSKYLQINGLDKRRTKSKPKQFQPLSPVKLVSYPTELQQQIFNLPNMSQDQIYKAKNLYKFNELQKSTKNQKKNLVYHPTYPTYTPSFIRKREEKNKKVQNVNLSLNFLNQSSHPTNMVKSSSFLDFHYLEPKEWYSKRDYPLNHNEITKNKNPNLKMEIQNLKNKITPVPFDSKEQRDTLHTQTYFQDEIKELGLQIQKGQYEKQFQLLESSRFQTHKRASSYTMADFQKIKQLGEGHYGQVYLVRQKKIGFICALKQIPKNKLKQDLLGDQLIRELKIHFFLNHPNIIKMYGCFEDRNNIYLIIQAVLGGPLDEFLRKRKIISEVKSISIMKQICDSVHYLHSNRIIHRDIKPQNIVIHEGVPKLCDFGWSVYLENNQLRTTFCGTPLYVSPEILKGKQYDTKVDVWTLGILIYELLIGQCPFRVTKQQQLTKILTQQPKIPSNLNISQSAIDFISKCLQKKPQNRPNIEELLQHTIFSSYNRRVILPLP